MARVYYPGLESFPQKALAQRQQSTYGGMLSFELKAGPTEAIAVMNAMKLWIRAESLGGVESLVTHPATATHADVPVEIRHRLGISDGLIRLSVGLEAAQDLIADLRQALDSVFGANSERSANHEVCQQAG